MRLSRRIKLLCGIIGAVEAQQTDSLTGAPFMKSLAITAACVLGFTAQAMAESASTPKFNPGVAPQLAQDYVPKYDIVTAKVAQAVKFENPALANGLNPEPQPPSKALLPSR
jgi:hypothetical protein